MDEKLKRLIVATTDESLFTWTDPKMVGRAYGCVVNCENVVVENVKINDVAATDATLVGDKGYTGTVTVK